MKFLEALEKYILYITIFLVPLAFANLFSNFFDFPKILLLSLGVALTILIVSLKSLISGKLILRVSQFDFPLLLLLAAYLISAFFRTPSKMDAFFFPGTATIVSAGVLLYFLLNILSVGKRAIGVGLVLSGTLMAVFYLLAAAGILEKVPSLPDFVKNPSFSPMGGLLPQAIFLATVLPLGLSLALSEKEVAKKLFLTVALAVSSLALALSIFNILPGKPDSPALPPFETSWAVAIESIKQSPLLGIGPGNYLTAFSRFKPLSYNATNLWAVRFTTATDFPLTLLTEVGLLGLAALVLIYWKALMGLKKKVGAEFDFERAASLSLLASLVFLLLFPASIALIILFFLLLFLNARVSEVTLFRTPVFVLASALAIGVLLLGYYGGRAFLAESEYRRALNFLVANDGKGSYDTMRETIRLNPYVDRYHASYAQINMALARSIAQKGENITEEERNTITTLIQQAIREGRATVTLNPSRSGNWEILARIYQAIMPFAQGADNFAIQSFNQSVALDPTNPNLRIALGGIYYALGRYDEAIRAFELSVLSKPDLANAHYNLAVAYREKGEIEKAIEQMKLVLSLVEKDSSDYELAKTELDNLEKKRPATEESSENLTPPPPAEEPAITPPLTLPEDSTPPATAE